MGDHSDLGECPFCEFEEMRMYYGFRNYAYYYMEMFCPLCGFARWTDGKDPEKEDVELAKRLRKQIDLRRLRKAIEVLWEDQNIILVNKYRENPELEFFKPRPRKKRS